MTASPVTVRPSLNLILLTLACALIVAGPGSYWLLHHQHLPLLANTNLFARLFAALSDADRGYFDAAGQLQLGLVGTMVPVGLLLYGALFAAWLRNAPSAVPLALAVGSIGCYCALISGWIGVIEGFPRMARTTAGASLLFGALAAWFAIHLALFATAFNRIAASLRLISSRSMHPESWR